MGQVKILEPLLLTEDLHALRANSTVSDLGYNWMLSYGTLRDPSVQREVLGRRVPRPEKATLEGFVRSSLLIEGEEFPDLVGGHPMNVRADVLLLALSFEELKRCNVYETDHYTLKYVKVSGWAAPVVGYFGRESWAKWNQAPKMGFLASVR